jgi:hypothetical protein
MLSHVQETLQRWQEAERAEHAYRRWAAFFYPLLGDTATAEALCELGLRVVRREIAPGTKVRGEVDRILDNRPSGTTAGAPPPD